MCDDLGSEKRRWANCHSYFAPLFDCIHQLGEVLALFRAKRVAVLSVAEGDDEADRGIEVAELTELFIVEPAEDAGAKPLRGGFSSDIGGENTDVDGAIVIPLHLGAEGGGGDVGLLRDDQQNGCIGGIPIPCVALATVFVASPLHTVI